MELAELGEFKWLDCKVLWCKSDKFAEVSLVRIHGCKIDK